MALKIWQWFLISITLLGVAVAALCWSYYHETTAQHRIIGSLQELIHLRGVNLNSNIPFDVKVKNDKWFECEADSLFKIADNLR